MSESLGGALAFLLFLGFGGYILWSMFSKRGHGRMLGGEIIGSATEEIVQKEMLLTTTIRVHTIRTSSNTTHVGIGISENARLGASFKPIRLSKAEAEKLVRMINEAAAGT